MVSPRLSLRSPPAAAREVSRRTSAPLLNVPDAPPPKVPITLDIVPSDSPLPPTAERELRVLSCEKSPLATSAGSARKSPEARRSQEARKSPAARKSPEARKSPGARRSPEVQKTPGPKSPPRASAGIPNGMLPKAKSPSSAQPKERGGDSGEVGLRPVSPPGGPSPQSIGTQHEYLSAVLDESSPPRFNTYDGSQLAVHEEEFRAKVERKCEELRKEVMKEATKECTFAPQLCAYPLAARPAFEDRVRQAPERKLETVRALEQDVYGDLTHRPKITPRASRAKDAPACVHERLYQQRPAPRLVESTPVFQPTLVTRSRPRACSTTDLLYSDAIDRWHRRRVQVAVHREQEEGARQTHCRVSSSSRRYFWQALEKQIKAAFDATTDASKGVLGYNQLVAFLQHLGCWPAALKPGEQKARQLCLSLWEQLDPACTGEVDLLTVTVFLHVLMGATEKLEPRPFEPLRREPERPASLASIAEEEERRPGAAARSRSEPPVREARIDELVHRFDPAQLRANFKDLYLTRLQVTRRPRPARTPSPERCGHMDPHSRQLANKAEKDIRRSILAEKNASNGAKVTSPDGPMSHVDLMMWRREKTQERKQKLESRAKEQEMSECTFQPELQRPLRDWCGTAPRTFAEGLPKHEELYLRHREYNGNRVREQASSAEADMEKHAAECPFAPDMSLTAKRERRKARAATLSDTVRGSDAYKERMHRAEEMKLRQQKFEDAMLHPKCKLKEVTPFNLHTERIASQRTTPSAQSPRSSLRSTPRSYCASPGVPGCASARRRQPRGRTLGPRAVSPDPYEPPEYPPRVEYFDGSASPRSLSRGRSHSRERRSASPARSPHVVAVERARGPAIERYPARGAHALRLGQ